MCVPGTQLYCIFVEAEKVGQLAKRSNLTYDKLTLNVKIQNSTLASVTVQQSNNPSIHGQSIFICTFKRPADTYAQDLNKKTR
jgi:hypothetical protein